MRKAAMGIAAVAAMIGTPALAADMPVKAPPLPAAVYSWTGFYIGANGGYGWGGWNSNSIAAIFPDGVTTNADPDVKGWFGGVTAGYNWQTSQQWVVGVEGDFDWTGERASDGSNASTTAPGPSTGFCDFGGGCSIVTTTTFANDWRKLWFATLRGRVGFLIEPTWLLYGTAGIAFAETKFSTSSSTTVSLVRNATGQVGSSTTTGASLSETSDRTGFAVGGGVEKLLTQYWSVKAEYLFLDFGSHTFLSGTGFDTNIRLIDNIARVGVDYHFH